MRQVNCESGNACKLEESKFLQAGGKMDSTQTSNSGVSARESHYLIPYETFSQNPHNNVQANEVPEASYEEATQFTPMISSKSSVKQRISRSAKKVIKKVKSGTKKNTKQQQVGRGRKLKKVVFKKSGGKNQKQKCKRKK